MNSELSCHHGSSEGAWSEASAISASGSVGEGSMLTRSPRVRLPVGKQKPNSERKLRQRRLDHERKIGDGSHRLPDRATRLLQHGTEPWECLCQPGARHVARLAFDEQI